MSKESIELAKKIRKTSVEMVYKAHASHIGGALSMADILAVLYSDVLNQKPEKPDWGKRDRCLLSKGHACVSFYAVLAHKGYYSVEALDTYAQNGSAFLCHTTHHVPGIEISAGSLGHGLPIACGIALGAKIKGEEFKTYVILGDGEMDEGSNWEAFLFGAHHKLSNLCVIIDYNKIQSFGNTNDVLCLEPLERKMKNFNWNVVSVDGHDHDALRQAFEAFNCENEKPTVIIAHTIKGKGVSFMENSLAWHYKSPDEEQYKQAIKEIVG
ncbi:MAG: transketolase [Bacteroidales bacterium]|nr:transketolase [Bacteroidales bacterium]